MHEPRRQAHPRGLVAAGLALAGCGLSAATPAPATDRGAVIAPAPAKPPPVGPAIAPWGFDLAGMDRSVDPGESFYRFANGRWLATTPIAPDRSMTAMFMVVYERNQERVRAIVEAARGAPGSDDQRIGDYYRTLLDEAAIERGGLAPIQPRLDDLARLRDLPGVLHALAESARRGVDTPLAISIRTDPRAPDAYVATLEQGGLGLPDRGMYDAKARQFDAQRAGYRRYIATMFALAGLADAEPRAAAVYALEDRLAQSHWTRVQNRDPQATYNLRTLPQLQALAPAIDWRSWLAATGVPASAKINVVQPSAIAATARLLRTQPRAVWQDYLILHALSDAAPYLPKRFAAAHFEMFDHTLWGVAAPEPRWRRSVEDTSRALGDAVGQRYVARHFPPAARAQAERLVGDVLVAMRARLDALTWMSDETKARARAKLAAYRVKIGGPDVARDDTKLRIVAGDAVGNAERARALDYDQRLARLGTPVDRDAWSVTAMTADAFYSASRNEIVFPAGLFQPPFFDPAADPAVNYGAIGSLIGHEISHGFDDQGAQHDGTGALARWWTPADAARFQAATAQLVAQYNGYCPIAAREGHPAQCVNGALTLGENIADLGGVAIAYDAYQRSLGGAPAPILDGWTGAQRFFLGWAQIARCVYREQALASALDHDPHSPAELRIATARNLDAWYDAFQPSATGALYLPPAQRVRIW